MKVTLSAAMRARDVSRPRDEDEEAARRGDRPAAAGNTRGRAGRPDGGERTGRTDGGDRTGRTDGGDRPGRTETGDRAGAAKNSGGRRRKRR
jgi:hypothetical protein